jgi:hypothetical protein
VKNQKLLDAIDKFAVMAEIPATKLSPVSKLPIPTDNIAFQAQRTRLADFYQYFSQNLRRVTNEMANDLANLKARGFDPKMLKLLVRVYDSIFNIYQVTDPERPYLGAEKLARYALDKPNALYIDNLDFLGKHHLMKTNVVFKVSPSLEHPKLRSLDALKSLAAEARSFMERNPLIKPLTPTIPPIGSTINMNNIPSFLGGRDDKTKG